MAVSEPAGPRVMARRYRRENLPGGLRLVTAPQADRESVSVSLMFRVGSRDEPARLNGASHFIEHLLFKGTERRPKAKDIAAAIEGVGGNFNAGTDKEMTVYYARVPADKLDLAIDVLCDMVVNSRFDPADIDRERSVILEELAMYQDTPQDQVHTHLDAMLWPDHPLGRDIAGTEESVAALTRDDLLEYRARTYVGGSLLAAVAGRLSHSVVRDSLLARLDGHLGGSAVGFEPVVKAPLHPAVHLHEKATEQAHICLGLRGLSYHDPERFILDLANVVLGEGMSSRLFLEIREELGLAYDVHSYVAKHKDTGGLVVYAGVDPKKAEAATAALVAQLRRLAEKPVGTTELERAREYYKGRLVLNLESTNALASWLGSQELLMGRILGVSRILSAVNSVTPERIQHLMKRILKGPMQLAVIGPFSSPAKFERLVGV